MMFYNAKDPPMMLNKQGCSERERKDGISKMWMPHKRERGKKMTSPIDVQDEAKLMKER
jgi:hypothetical protein